MRILRRAALVLSLALIVAICIGYFARVSAVEQQRDLGLINEAEVAASRLASVFDGVQLAVATGTDPDVTAESVGTMYPSLGACVTDGSRNVCAGSGAHPADDLVQAAAERRASTSIVDTAPRVDAYESGVLIAADGPTLSVLAQAPISTVGSRGDVTVWVTTFLPAGSTVETFVVEDGLRQWATPVESAPGVFVVAAAEDGTQLPVDERRFYALIFMLSVLLLALAGITLVVEQRNLVERASFDPLTKLPNRGEFERRAADAITAATRHESGMCLLLFDLNGFKKINDTYGHQTGDEMLKVVGSRLRKAVRDEDIVSRWGGDEFVVVMPGVGDVEMGERRARQLSEQISGRTRLEGADESLRVQVSVGVALWPQHGAELADLVEAADQAMYEAKRAGDVCHVATTAGNAVTSAVR